MITHRRPLAHRRCRSSCRRSSRSSSSDRPRAGCPVTARCARRARASSSQLEYLLLPALRARRSCSSATSPRMARAGMIEALDADYTRTAYLKGLGRRTVMFKHVLRNALLPTIAVVATQTGYLLGGLLVIESAPSTTTGIGQRDLHRARRTRTSRSLQSGVPWSIGIDLPHRRRCSPTSPTRCSIRASASGQPNERAATTPPSAVGIPMAAPARSSRRETFDAAHALAHVPDRRVRRSPSGSFCAIFGYAIAPHDPPFQRRRHPASAELGSTRSAPTRSAATCSRA